VEERMSEGLITKALHYVLAFSLAAMVLLVFLNAVLRYAASSGITQAEELSRYFFVWTSFLGTIVAFKDNKHVGVDIVITKLTGKVRLVVDIIGYLLMMFVVAIMAWGGYNYFLIAMTSKGPATGIPFSYVVLALIVAAVAMGILCIQKAYQELMSKGGE